MNQPTLRSVTLAAALVVGPAGAFAAAAAQAGKPTPAPARKSPAAARTHGSKPAPAAKKTPLPIYETYLVGDKAIAAAGKAASASGRRVVINFGTNDCGACRVVNDAIYAEPFFKAFMEQFVPVFIDVSPSNPNRELLSRYGIDPEKGLPAIVVSTKDLDPAVVTRDGEVAKAAAQGKEAVQSWFLAQFEKTSG